MAEQKKTPGAAGTATGEIEQASVGVSTPSSDPLQGPLDAVTAAERAVAAWRADVAEWRSRHGDTPLPPDAFYDHPACDMVARWIAAQMAVHDLPPRGPDGWRHIAAEILSVPNADGLFRLALHLEGISRIAENKVMRALTLAARAEAVGISLEHAALAAVVWELVEVHTGMTQGDDPQPVDFPPFVTLRVQA